MQTETDEPAKAWLQAIVSEQSPYLFGKAAERFMDHRAPVRWRAARAVCRAFNSEAPADITAIYRIYTTAGEQAIMWARSKPAVLSFPVSWDVVLDMWARPWAVTYFGHSHDRSQARHARLRAKRQALAAARGVPESLAAVEVAISQFQQMASRGQGSTSLADMGGAHEDTQDTSVAEIRRQLRQLRAAGGPASPQQCQGVCSAAHQCRKGLTPLA